MVIMPEERSPLLTKANRQTFPPETPLLLPSVMWKFRLVGDPRGIPTRTRQSTGRRGPWSRPSHGQIRRATRPTSSARTAAR